MSSSEAMGEGSTNAQPVTSEMGAAPRKKQRRGFAAMDTSKQKEIASKGGKASHAHGTGHEWNASSAREAGRKGGLASHGGRGKDAVKL
jgi:general stress protein YciG